MTNVSSLKFCECYIFLYIMIGPFGDNIDKDFEWTFDDTVT